MVWADQLSHAGPVLLWEVISERNVRYATGELPVP